MTEVSERYRKVADAFTARVRQVPPDRWDAPAPCEGWVARDVVRHLVEWLPGMLLSGAGLPAPHVPSVDEDPAGAWRAVDDALQAALDDPESAGRPLSGRSSGQTVESGLATFGIGDVLVHTWDLARATGQDERLDPDEVHRLWAAMTAFPEEQMRSSGHYGPRVEVPEDADEQTRLIAYTGRQP